MADLALTGRVALITGGGGEIGGAIAKRFASQGAHVAIADVRAEAAEATASAINSAGGGRAEAIEANASLVPDARRCVQKALELFGKLTTLVNVAATVTPDGTVETLTLDQWNDALTVNLTSVFLMCKYAVPAIRSAGGGTIVNIASQLGHIGVALRAPYTTSKAAMIQFTRCLAIDHAADGIRVNSLSPGGVDTARTLRRFNGDRAAANRARGPAHLLGRTGRPDEIADGALFLAADSSSFMTGADLLMDGGYLAFKGPLGIGSSQK